MLITNSIMATTQNKRLPDPFVSVMNHRTTIKRITAHFLYSNNQFPM